MRIEFSKDQIVHRMNFENPWWESCKIEAHYSSMRRREYFKLLMPLVVERDIKRAVVLMGPRRVGKTVLLFHAIQKLIDDGIPAKNICYLSVETPIYNGIALEELVQYFLGISGVKDELFVFFDEIQYLKDWEIHLKTLVDSYHKIKFIVSGSAAAALKLKSVESGAGRFTDFILPPLTFHEYLVLKNIDGLIEEEEIEEGSGEGYSLGVDCKAADIASLNKHFVHYINYGGYPEVSLSSAIQQDPGRYIRNDIVDKVLLRDLPLLYGIEDIQELNSLFTFIAYNTGCEMSLDSISQKSGVSKNTIKKYITYLEAAFLIKVVRRINETGKVFKRDNFFKIYLTNPSLRCALFTPLQATDNFMGNLVETAIFSQWQHGEADLYYARWKDGEVDIVHLDKRLKPSWLVEIKWSNKPATDDTELKNVKLFCRNHHLYHARFTTLNVTETKKIDGVKYDFVPASLYCYTVGRNLIYSKQHKRLL